MKTAYFRRISILFTLFSLMVGTVVVQADTQQHKNLKKDIKKLSTSLDAQKKQSAVLNAEIKRLDQQLSDIDRKQYQTEKKISQLQTKLQKANIRKRTLKAELKQQRGALAQQLQARYTAGKQSHLRLLLMQDKPADLSRNQKYFEYFDQYRIAKIDGVQTLLKELTTVTATIHEDQIALTKLNQDLAVQEKVLKKSLGAREAKFKTMRKGIRSDEKRLTKLKREEAKLQRVIQEVARKAAAREARRQAARQKQASASSGKSQMQQARTVTTRITPNKPFSSLKGKMSWPVRGKLIHRWRGKRNERQRWNGVVIAARGGTKVKAIAKGRVAYTGYMQGFGNLIIIEHDRKYLSLYGYNRAVYKREGQSVSANEVIASVGNSGGQAQNALYFEIRKGTQPQNPAAWCR